MLCYAKRISLFLRLCVFFITGLFISSVSNAQNNYDVLNNDSVIEKVSCIDNNCFFPNKELGKKDIHVTEQVVWDSDKNLVLHTKGNIVFEQGAKIISKKDGSTILKSGIEPGKKKETNFSVLFEDENDSAQIEMLGNGDVKIYYHPTKGSEKHKYLNPRYNFYKNHTKFMGEGRLILYMLVNDVYDLQNIGCFLSGNYALSQNIDASITRWWSDGNGFESLKDNSKNMPFSGNFDGNGYTIENLYINRPNDDKVGLFGMCSGFREKFNIIENITLKSPQITGGTYVGSLCGWATYSRVHNTIVVDANIKAVDIAGGIVGTSFEVILDEVSVKDLKIKARDYKGIIAGGTNSCNILLQPDSQEVLNLILKKPILLPIIGYDENKKSKISIICVQA